MKPRQYKKLCKKSASIIGLNKCDSEDGIFYVFFECGGYDSEWDSEDAWPFLVGAFDSEVNTLYDEDSECGMSWKLPTEFEKTNAINVLKWARLRYAK
jgi:hypothetical protein